MWNFLKYWIWKQKFSNQDTKCCQCKVGLCRCFWAAQVLGCYILPESKFSFLSKWPYSELLTLDPDFSGGKNMLTLSLCLDILKGVCSDINHSTVFDNEANKLWSRVKSSIHITSQANSGVFWGFFINIANHTVVLEYTY